MALVDGAAYERAMAQLDTERALADDLAEVLSRMVVGWEPILGHDLAQHPDVQRVMARYREARGPVRKPDRKMSNEEVDQAAHYREARK